MNQGAYFNPHMQADLTKPSVFVVAPFLLYFLLSPFYLFPSGYPQIADGFIALGLGFFILSTITHTGLKGRHVFMMGLAFSVLTIIINMVNYAFYPDPRFILSSLIYPFNIMVFIFAVKIMEQGGASLRDKICALIYIIVVIEVLYALIVPQTHWREIGSFNNPNQLAYWSLLTASMIAALKYGQRFTFLDLGAIALCGFIQMLSLSKAGIITFGLFSVILFFSPSLDNTKRALLSLGVFALAVFAILSTSQNLTEIEYIEDTVARLENVGQEPDDSFEGRGYDRIWIHPEYVLLGAGEGAYERFSNPPKELHSGLATILFSYGIFGAILFAYFLYLVFRNQPLYILALFIPVLMFGIPGQSFRFTHFWIFLAILYVSKDILPLTRNTLNR